jgi:hypothetical protein
MQCSLVQLFESMANNDAGLTFPVDAVTGCPGSLFAEDDKSDSTYIEDEDIAIITALHSNDGFDPAILPPAARRLYGLSVDDLDAIVLAWMSEFPVAAEIVEFGRKILAAADNVPRAAGQVQCSRIGLEERRAADRAAGDRIDQNVQAVKEAAYKAWHEINRLMGLLRFCPDEEGVYVARCEPDHFVVPALGPHFRERFGQTPWAIVDEKRCLCLAHQSGQLQWYYMDERAVSFEVTKHGKWEDLWRLYHRTINNESRNNPGLQKQFMPRRYWKYLTEM